MKILGLSPVSESYLMHKMFRLLAITRIQEIGCNKGRLFINFILILVVLYLFYDPSFLIFKLFLSCSVVSIRIIS